jgi:hypothetical protein
MKDTKHMKEELPQRSSNLRVFPKTQGEQLLEEASS